MRRASATSLPTVLFFFILTVLNLSDGQQVQQQEQQQSLITSKQWRLFTYNFQPNAPVNDVNFYNPTNVLATGIAIGLDRIFIATPKLFSGVPATLSFVSKAEVGDSPVLQAYPDWSFATNGRSNVSCGELGLVSVYRLRIDSCNRLWALDAGISRSLEDYEKTCPPKILVIDLQTNQVVRRIDFPPEILRGESLFTNLIIDETTSKDGSCDDVFVYISDTVEPAIVVYDSSRDVTWRLSHPAMYPDPDFAQSEILNDRFILMDGVVGLTFDSNSGTIYFQPLATDRIFSVTKDVLRAGPLVQNEILQVKLIGKKSSQGIGLFVSPIDRSLIFSPLSETAIASWNPTTNKQSVLAYDRDRLQFVADINSESSNKGVIYVLSSKFHRFFLKNLNMQEYNNRILQIQLPSSDTSGVFNFKLNSFPQNYQSSYPSNYLNKNVLNGSPTPSISYFTSPSISSKRPFGYAQLGLINYSMRNPFTALNRDESFPPTREQRRNSMLQMSYLDSLIDSPGLSTYSLSASTKTNHMPLDSRGYYYDRRAFE